MLQVPCTYTSPSLWGFFYCHILHTCQPSYFQQKCLNPIHFQCSTHDHTCLKSSCESILTHGFNTLITMQQSWATYMCACWKIIIEIYIKVPGSKIYMVDFIFTQDLATHNQMQLISKHNSIYNNGNKLTINLKTSSSKPNSKNKIVSKNRHVAIPLFGHLLNGYGQARHSMEHGLLIWSSMPLTFYTLYVLTQK